MDPSIIGTVTIASAPTVVPRATAPVTSVVRTGGPRVRGSNGRYAKSETA